MVSARISCPIRVIDGNAVGIGHCLELQDTADMGSGHRGLCAGCSFAEARRNDADARCRIVDGRIAGIGKTGEIIVVISQIRMSRRDEAKLHAVYASYPHQVVLRRSTLDTCAGLSH